MEFNWVKFPEDHVFFYSVRPLVDWTFKLIAWLSLTASLQVGAEITGSVYLWILVALSYLLIIFFLQSFFTWLRQVQFTGRLSFLAPKPRIAFTDPAKRFFDKAGDWITKFLVLCLLAFGVNVMHEAVGKIVDEIRISQKSQTR